MSNRKTETMLVPAYVGHFSCWRAECPDTCCSGWDIFTSPELLEKYREINELNACLAPVGASGEDEGCRESLRLCEDAEGHPCRMLSEARLCRIWQSLGETQLPATCHAYPAVTHRFAGRLERALSLSCPAAAQLAMNGGEMFDFVEAELPEAGGDVPAVDAGGGIEPGVLDEIRLFAIQLFKTDDLSNADRMIALGILCEQIDERVSGGDQASLAGIVLEVIDFVESGEVAEITAKIVDTPAQTGSIYAMLMGDLFQRVRSAHQRQVLQEACLGLGGRDSMPAADVVGRLYAAHCLSLQPEARALIDDTLRRFLLNEIVRVVFPWGGGVPTMRQYRYLVMLFGGLRLLLTGAAGGNGGQLDREQATRVLQVFCRLTMHNPGFLGRVEHMMTGADFDTLRRLFPLLK